MGTVGRATVLILFGVLWIACSGNQPGVDCLGETDCAADNEFCIADDFATLNGECRMTCPATTTVNGGAGDPCGLDSNCASNDCRNDLVGDPCVCAGGGTGGTGGTAGTGGGGGTGGAGGEACAQGEFQLAPMGAPVYMIVREVCYHGDSDLNGCMVENYRVPPSTDFSEFIDIFYGNTNPPCETPADNFLGEFVEANGRYLFFGVPDRAPPTSPVPSTESVASGTYSVIDGDPESGTFEFYWPAR